MGTPKLKQNKPDLFSYINYRKYLLDFYKYKKAIEPGYTYAIFAKDIGFNSHNYPNLIIAGKRNLAPKHMKGLLSILKLDKNEEKYFKALVDWSQCEDHAKLAKHWDEVLLASKGVDKAHQLKPMQLQVLTQWQSIAILEMLHLKDAQWDVKWIQRRLRSKVSEEKIEQILTILKDAGLVIKEDGKLLPMTHSLVIAPSDIPSKLIRMYHHEVGKDASESLATVPAAKREFGATSLAIKDHHLPKIKAAIRKFNQELLDITKDNEDSDHVYQINFQMYPVTEDVGED